MKLYGHPLSSCTRKILLLLAEKGISLASEDFVIVDLFAHEQRSAAHLARHPFGVVPVLDDDGFVLCESRAILRYLDARVPEPRLTPTEMRARARMDQWLSIDQSYIAPFTRALAVERILKKTPDEAVVRDAEAALARAFEVVDQTLSAQPFIAGDAISLADLSLAPYVASLPAIGAERLVARLPHLGGWFERARARASWRAIPSA
jgi:glutathione S-transferase